MLDQEENFVEADDDGWDDAGDVQDEDGWD